MKKQQSILFRLTLFLKKLFLTYLRLYTPVLFLFLITLLELWYEHVCDKSSPKVNIIFISSSGAASMKFSFHTSKIVRP